LLAEVASARDIRCVFSTTETYPCGRSSTKPE